jgi:hypothetical protein
MPVYTTARASPVIVPLLNTCTATAATAAAVPTSQALTSVEQLERFLPFLKELDKTSIWFSLVSGYLPVIALLGLINALPFLFQAIAEKYEVSASGMPHQLLRNVSSSALVGKGVDTLECIAVLEPQ